MPDFLNVVDVPGSVKEGDGFLIAFVTPPILVGEAEVKSCDVVLWKVDFRIAGVGCILSD